MPAVLRALAQLRIQPDLGVLLDWPVFGVAKSRLTGTYAEPADVTGAQSPLLRAKAVIGAVLRTKAKTKPVYVSIGHRITLVEAVALTFACTTRYRLPEPTRQAHLLSKRIAERGDVAG